MNQSIRMARHPMALEAAEECDVLLSTAHWSGYYAFPYSSKIPGELDFIEPLPSGCPDQVSSGYASSNTALFAVPPAADLSSTEASMLNTAAPAPSSKDSWRL